MDVSESSKFVCLEMACGVSTLEEQWTLSKLTSLTEGRRESPYRPEGCVIVRHYGLSRPNRHERGGGGGGRDRTRAQVVIALAVCVHVPAGMGGTHSCVETPSRVGCFRVKLDSKADTHLSQQKYPLQRGHKNDTISGKTPIFSPELRSVAQTASA